jgi:pseudaminic acid cytidylyltransferase
MNQLAVIPARGGSKRLPRKNIINFYGKPMITYTIKAALECNLFDRVIVSTEDREIGEISKEFGAEVIIRPMELASDTARVVDVCLHALDSEIGHGRSYDILCCLYATAPLRDSADIKNTVELVRNGESDFAMAVTGYHYPPHQAMVEKESGYLEPMWPNLVHKNHSDLPKMLVDNGSTYVTRVSEFLKLKTFYGPNLKAYFMPRSHSVDIDVPDDLEFAEFYAGKAFK